ncbi:hypothetical protein JTE90_022112 [Oedothorax gibbosus]|uniref:Ionotropic glutamate receptor C-terminal domain-containing protein n=1 Tax=Oedothorax gibbosus TaxID=931172 RepID=A0AAV6VUE6_9ARAC|nr:hypothetical protein JTE90_022112 [Oedothorax gibbosus]
MQKLRVRFANWHPYSIVKHSQGKIELGGGIVKEIYEGIKAVKGLDYEAIFQPGNHFGERIANGTWTGMLGSTINNVWLALIFSLLCVPLAACIIHKDLPSSRKRSRTELFLNYFWAYQVSLLGQNFGSNKRPFLRSVQKSIGFRILQCTWFLAACFILMSIYKSSITSTFSASKLIPRFETMDELVKDTDMEIGTYEHNYGHTFSKTLIGTRYESIYHKVEKNLYRNINETTPEWMDRVENGRLVFIGPLSQMKNNIGNRFLATGKCGLRVTGMHWGSSYIALIFGKHFRDTSILRQFNQFLQRFNEGNIAHLEISHSDLYYDICTATSTAVSKALKLSDLLGAFIVFVSGMIISICVLVIELIVK